MIFRGINIPNFSTNEFPEGELKFASMEIIQSIQKVRTELGYSIYPSRVKGALSRIKKGTSRHCALDRESDAIDWFPKKGQNLFELFSTLLEMRLFGGIGIYFDTTGYPSSSDIMIHTDLRPIDAYKRTLIWMRADGEYLYPIKDPKLYTDLYTRLGGKS